MYKLNLNEMTIDDIDKREIVCLVDTRRPDLFESKVNTMLDKANTLEEIKENNLNWNFIKRVLEFRRFDLKIDIETLEFFEEFDDKVEDLNKELECIEKEYKKILVLQQISNKL
ncbi:hypothetical protein EXQ37_18290 [Clostridium botulinum]|nr:hypothetical protein [Clostridium botulinum]MBO0561544.1 hypothetical protein [Clostridium botulinum]